jgi:hypothetical protein
MYISDLSYWNNTAPIGTVLAAALPLGFAYGQGNLFDRPA